MSVNTAHANGGVLIHAGETILIFSDNVQMEFAGQDSPLFKGTKQGRIYLTTHRIIFNSKNPKDAMQSFSSPFISMSEVELEQPVFGANYIKGKIRAQQNGNFTGESKFKLSFKSGGCIDFGQALLRAASMAQRNSNGMAPPPYEPPGNGYYEAPPPAYTANPGTYGWLPQNSAFGQAPTNGVYMSDAPPPYPGINPGINQNSPNFPPPSYNQTPYAQGAPGIPPQYGFNNNNSNNATGFTAPYPGVSNQYPNGPSYPNNAGPSYPTLPQQSFGFNAPSAPGAQPMTKEQEAANSAFYDPRNMNSAFVQQQQRFDVPPAYDSLNNPNNPDIKKTQ